MAGKKSELNGGYSYQVSAVILAAGKGTRMKSDIPKVLHQVCGKPIINYVIRTVENLRCNPAVIVVGYQEEKVREVLNGKKVIFISQKEQLGTGHAVLQTENALKNYENDVLILCGDMPLVKPQTLKEFIDDHVDTESTLSIITTNTENPSNYGRVVRDDDFRIIKIVEEKDASEEEKSIKEINTGIYCVNRNFLFSTLRRLKPENRQNEYYLTDIIAKAVEKGIDVNSFRVNDEREFMGINTIDDLKDVEELMIHVNQALN